jgi:hypothetical protein
VLILSAKYGLIRPKRKIPWYDQCLSAAVAGRLRRQVLKAVGRIRRSRAWRAVGVCAGKDYQSALDRLTELLPTGVQFDLLAGGLVERLAALWNWLCQEHSATEGKGASC